MTKYTKEELMALYKELKSVKKIAVRLKKPVKDVKSRLKDLGIRTLRKEIKKSDILKLLKELGTVKKVAEKLGVSDSTLYYFISKYEIKLIKRRFPYSKQELIDLHKSCGSITKVASSLSRNYSTVRHWYKEFNIVINDSNMTVFQELRNTPMSIQHKSALIGSMLGDGGIWLAPHSKNARLYVAHCEKQLGYLKWLHSVLDPFSRPIKQTEKAGKKILADRVVTNSNFYRFYTIAHPDVTKIYKEYYSKNHKRILPSIIPKIDLLAMSIWFADDGTIQRNKSGETISCSIATCSFNYKEHLILVEALRKFFKGTITIKKHGGYYKDVPREDYIIHMTGKTYVKEFLSNIRLILPECIHYKLS